MELSSHAVSASEPSTQRLELPVEVWERIIDIVATESKRGDNNNWTSHPGWGTLIACTLVCKSWYHRSWFHLHWQISVRSREQVVALSRLIRAEPHLREAVQRIAIAGGLDQDQRRLPIPHMATFVAMLACKLPNVKELIVRHAEWRVADIQPKSLSYVPHAFQSVASLKLVNVTFASAMLFGRLVSALPALTWMHCVVVRCTQDEPGPVDILSPLPRTSRELSALALCEPIDPAIQAFLIRCAEEDGCQLQFLSLEMDIPSPFTLASKKGQHLLDSSRAHLRFFVLTLYMGDVSPDVQKAALEPHINLARALKLERLTVECSCPIDPDFSWISTIASSIVSDVMHEEDPLRRLEILLARLDQHADLTLLDGVLAGKQFANIRARGVGVFLDLSPELRALQPAAVGRLEEQWQEQVKRKMPRLNERGMLRAFVWT
ncbi:uncharacterized protein B0H18DRAFT_993975 [Fomitopsis serialis]|uniref:uncharacterized protein n=1 Tax=Fomitopsis serialis TaxID=139415 RepID=UPI002007E3C9|nr:uncharacterized protein B0H18DRAFT_993975 [Neoantrodia serialis]KAH9930250.1 hypothetical protein B0H18DRAFT_993975 [Neoantrodia serialis]